MASSDPTAKPSLNVFEAAIARPSSDVTIGWTARDVQRLRPDWNPHECEEFLRGVASRFAHGMLRMGLSLLQELSVDPRFGGKPLTHDSAPTNPPES